MIVFHKKIFHAILQKNHPNLQENQIQWFDNGWDHVIAVVNETTAYRFPRREDYVKKLPIETTFTELIINQLPLPIPRLELRHDNNFVYAIYPFLEGEPLSRDLFAALDHEKHNTLAQQLGDFITSLHSFPVDKALHLGIQQVDSIESWKSRFERIKTLVYPIIDSKEQMWIETLFNNYFNIVQEIPFDEVVVHGDIAPEHILFDMKTHTIAGIIDFGDVSISDPAFDFFHLSYFYGEDFLKQVYSYYKLPRDTGFDDRRKFYHNRWPVTNLEHSALTKNEASIQLHKEQLTEYIQKNSL